MNPFQLLADWVYEASEDFFDLQYRIFGDCMLFVPITFVVICGEIAYIGYHVFGWR